VSKLKRLKALVEDSSTIEQEAFRKPFVERIEADDSQIKAIYTIPMPPDNPPAETVEFCPLFTQVHHKGNCITSIWPAVIQLPDYSAFGSALSCGQICQLYQINATRNDVSTAGVLRTSDCSAVCHNELQVNAHSSNPAQ
jgi:hypothetical protein